MFVVAIGKAAAFVKSAAFISPKVMVAPGVELEATPKKALETCMPCPVTEKRLAKRIPSLLPLEIKLLVPTVT